MGWTEFRKEYVGQFHPWIPHSTVVRKEAILNSGILEFREKWSGEFEGIYCTFLQKIKNLKKCDDAIFLWRTHANQVSWNVQEDKDFVQIWDITSSCKFAKRHLTQRKAFYKEASYPFDVEKLKYK